MSIHYELSHFDLYEIINHKSIIVIQKTLKHHVPFNQLIPKLEDADLRVKVTTDAVYVAIGSDDNLVQLRKVSDHEIVCRLADNSNDDSPVIVENKTCVM